MPLETADNLSIGFELPQKSEAWIDNVAISDLYFTENERQNLYKTIEPLYAKFSQGELESCWRAEQGYWLQFLKDCVELRNVPSAPLAQTAPYSGAVGTSANNFGNITDKSKRPTGANFDPRAAARIGNGASPSPAKTQSSAPPTQVSGTNPKKNLFGLGKPENVSVPLPNPTVPDPAPEPEKKTEKKSFWQQATDWFTRKK